MAVRHLFKSLERNLRRLRNTLTRGAFYLVRPLIPKAQALAGQEHILVIRIDAIGDMVIFSAFLRELRRNKPNAFITLIIHQRTYNIVELCPYVDEIIKASDRHSVREALRLCREYLWKQHYALALIPLHGVAVRRSAGWISFFARAERSISYDYTVGLDGSMSDPNDDKLFTEVIGITHLQNEAQRNLDMLRYLGFSVENEKMELWTNDADKAFATEMMAPLLTNPESIRVALLLSTNEKKRDYPVERFLKVVRALKEKYNLSIVLIGGGDTTGAYGREFMQSEPDCLNLIGKTSLRQLAEVMRQCDCYLGGDTGPLHIADALNLPGVGIYYSPIHMTGHAAQIPVRFGPWQALIKVLRPLDPLPGCEDGCEKKYAHCITQVTVEEVVSAMEEIIEKHLKNRA